MKTKANELIAKWRADARRQQDAATTASNQHKDKIAAKHLAAAGTLLSAAQQLQQIVTEQEKVDAAKPAFQPFVDAAVKAD